MKEITKKAGGYREQLALLALQSPDILFLLLLCGFGGAAVGWLFIGIGSLFALVPLMGFALYYQVRLKQKNADSV